MATDARGHTTPAATDAPARTAITNLSLSIRDIAYVADTSGRSTLVSNLAAAGKTISASEPLYVHRADAGSGKYLEMSIDGSTFYTIRADVTGQTWTPSYTNLTIGNGTVVTRVSRREGWVFGYWTLTVGSTTSFSGTVTVSLPETALATVTGIGTGYAIDASASGAASRKSLIVVSDGAATGFIMRPVDGDLLTNTVPWTWASGDTIRVTFAYPYI